MLSFSATFIRLFTACVLGGVIGYEREKKNRKAGLRTHILVCLGSCLIMLVSLYIYDIYQGRAPADLARIAAGVVTGIGFLGAGTIIRSSEGIRGLTTAASIWAAAAIGLAVGVGMYWASVVTAVVVLAVLILSRLEERMAIKKKDKKDF